MLQLPSCVQLFVTPWTVAHQVPLSMGFSRQKYWSGLPSPPPGYFPDPGVESKSPASPTSVGGFFTTVPPGKPHNASATAKSLQSCLTLCDPIDSSPPSFPLPWDSPGKNTGVGCHFLLQCVKVKSESEVAQSCLTLHNPMDCSPPGSSIHGIFQARVLKWGAIAFSVMPLRSIQIRCISVVCPFSLLCNIPQCGFTTVCLTTDAVRNILVFCNF